MYCKDVHNKLWFHIYSAAELPPFSRKIFFLSFNLVCFARFYLKAVGRKGNQSRSTINKYKNSTSVSTFFGSYLEEVLRSADGYLLNRLDSAT